MPKTSSGVVNLIRENLHPITGASSDYDPLIQQIGEARFVLIGEASHGTHEFYRERAQITKRLIQENGFTAVAVEADWPDAYRVNRYVRGASADADAIDSLAGFKRFPTWMWAMLKCWILSVGCGRITIRSRMAPRKPVSTVSIFTVCTPLLKLCLATSLR